MSSNRVEVACQYGPAGPRDHGTYMRQGKSTARGVRCDRCPCYGPDGSSLSTKEIMPAREE
ncbi:hypothetical protein KUTG_00704 [Kutzneria sp. 744]|nr:hypothetical protein KUTG_00704 [Kutzneria sp. 744]